MNADVIRALTGDDFVNARDGNDLVRAGAGNDVVQGDHGSDTTFGGAGDDRIRSGNADDVAWGGSGSDTVRGGQGPDELHGGTGADAVYGGEGDDVLHALAPDSDADTLSCGPGRDTAKVRGSERASTTIRGCETIVVVVTPSADDEAAESDRDADAE